MKCDLLIKNCSLLTFDFNVIEEQSIAINSSKVLEFGPAIDINRKYEATTVVDGKGKLAMPGLIDAHIHTCQQFLRGRTMDEYPMIWTRFLVPFESNLTPDDVYHSARLSCLEMIKAGTTSFADSGGVHMHKVVDAVIESGMRAAIAKSTMDIGGIIADPMKETAEESVKGTEELYKGYQSKGDGRIDIWFAIRQVMTCSPKLVRMVGEKAKEYSTGIHAHLCEHKDEVSFCLQNYKKRPAEFLDEMGVLGSNLLTAHNVVLSESDITLMKNRDVKVVHCPRSNFSSHGFPKTPRMIEMGISVGLGTDGAAQSSLSLFDEIKVFHSGIKAFWGLPIFDPVVLPAKELIKMATLGGAKALQLEDKIGTIEIGKNADIILIDIDKPHILPTHNILKTFVGAVNAHDVNDVIINGKLVMKNREVLTLDEEEILYNSKKRLESITHRAGI